MLTSFRRLLAASIALLWQGGLLFAQDSDGLAETQAPALQFTMAAVSFLLIMLILCMPSRKRQAEKKT